MGTTINTALIRNFLLCIGETDLKNRKEKAFLTETWFHKLLFDLKQKAENKEIKNSLQFYWYKHGPFCEPARTELNKLVQEGIFSRNENGFVFYRLEKKAKFIEMESFAEAKTVLEQIISETDLFRLRFKEKEIYDNAPYKFMQKYKFDYLEIIKDFKYLSETEQDNKTFLNNYKEKLISSLYECESLLPLDRTFSDFNQIFANMVGEIVIFLSTEQTLDQFLLGESIRVSEDAWDCFTKGVRVEHHDNYYDGKVGYWKKDFFDSIKRYNKTVALLNEEILEKYANISLNPIEPKTDTNTIMKAIVLGYTK